MAQDMLHIGGREDDGSTGPVAAPAETRIESPKLKLDDICVLPNICDQLDDGYINQLGTILFEDFDADLRSRTEWDAKMDTANKLALQVVKEKSFPWANASNVKFPLITIAALQYHARAYPSLVVPDDIVKYKVYGDDPGGKMDATGRKIAKHMTYQLTEEDRDWEEGMDRALIVQPIMGCVFKKTWFDLARKKNISECVLPKDLVVNYYAKSLEQSPRVSHILPMSKNDVHYRIVKGFFRDINLPAPRPAVSPTSPQEASKDAAQGTRPDIYDRQSPYVLIEQHCWIDMDGDGYLEPYVATFDRDSKKILRIVARYAKPDIEYESKKVARISAENYFTKYPFIPSPDGGFYDLGFGVLLSPLTRSIDSIINQLIDAGTLANAAGGFLGKGIKLRGGQFNFKPFGWTPIDTIGDDIRKNIVEIPVRAPSEVLFRLLGFLVDYGERICNATETNVGVAPGQNTPAETSRATGENGLKILSAIFKRTWRSQRDEFRKLYRLNATFLDLMKSNPFQLVQADYQMSEMGIRPAADPVIMSDGMRLQQAKLTFDLVNQPGVPGDKYVAARRVLEAAKVPDIDMVLPDPKGPNAIQAPPNPKLIEAQAKLQRVQNDHQVKMLGVREKLAKLLKEIDESRAKIDLMEAQAQKARAEAKGVGDGQKLALIDAEIGARKAHFSILNDAANSLREMMKETDDGAGTAGADQPGGVPKVAAGPSDAAGDAGGGGQAPAADGGVGGPGV